MSNTITITYQSSVLALLFFPICLNLGSACRLDSFCTIFPAMYSALARCEVVERHFLFLSCPLKPPPAKTVGRITIESWVGSWSDHKLCRTKDQQAYDHGSRKRSCLDNYGDNYGGYLSNRPRKTKENKGKPIKTYGLLFSIFLGFPRFCLFSLGFPRFPCYLGSPRREVQSVSGGALGHRLRHYCFRHCLGLPG